MLNQFFCDWNTAIQSRTIVNETRNSAGVITMQETKFKFRDVEITMFSRIIPSSINLPPEKRRWTSEMFVPSTNKIIPSVRYNSRARCAAEIMAALRYGQKVKTSWSGGTVIRGRITREFLSFLAEAKKPTDTEIYNKMTPFFTIVFGNKLHSEHYGTEIIISKVIREKQPAVDRILDQMSEVGTVHRNIG